MITISVSLPNAMKEFVESQAAEQGYDSVSDYFHSVIRDLQMRQAKQKLEMKLQESLLSGPAETMTREEWDSIEQEAMRKIDSINDNSAQTQP